MRAKKLLLCLIVGLQCGTKREVLENRSQQFIQDLLDHKEQISSYDLTPREKFVQLAQVLHMLELIADYLSIQEYGHITALDPNPRVLRKALDENPIEFIRRPFFDLGIEIPVRTIVFIAMRNLIEKLRTRHLVPRDMQEEELIKRLSIIQMKMRHNLFKFDLVPEELQYNIKSSIEFLQGLFFGLAQELKDLNLSSITLHTSFAAYRAMEHAEEYFKDSAEMMEFLAENRTKILILVTSGEISPLEEAEVEPGHLINELHRLPEMNLITAIQERKLRLPLPSVPLSLKHLSTEQISQLVLQRAYLRAIGITGSNLSQDYVDSVAFIDAYPDLAYFYDKVIARPNIDLDEQLDWVARELRNPHFSHVFEGEAIDSSKFTTYFNSFIKVQLRGLICLGPLNQKQSTDMASKILRDHYILKALKAIKAELPKININYEPSTSGITEENNEVLTLILHLIKKTGFCFMEDIDPAKLRTFLETKHSDLFKKAAQYVVHYWTTVLE